MRLGGALNFLSLSLSLSLFFSLSHNYSGGWIGDWVALSVQSLLLGSRDFFLGFLALGWPWRALALRIALALMAWKADTPMIRLATQHVHDTPLSAFICTDFGHNSCATGA